MSSSKKNWPEKGFCGRCLSRFIDWSYSQSCWYFRPRFVNCCPSNLLSSSTLPPPSCVKSIPHTRIQCVRGGGLGLRQIKTCRKVPFQAIFYMMIFCIAFYESYLSTRCPFPVFSTPLDKKLIIGDSTLFVRGCGIQILFLLPSLYR
jgi:hypothetical protein